LKKNGSASDDSSGIRDTKMRWVNMKMDFFPSCIFVFALLLPSVCPVAEPKGFTEDPYVDDEKFREKVTKHEVVAVAGEKTAIPCDCTPTSSHPEDKPVLILWYKDQGKLPIYSFDLRSSSGQHWKDTNTLGERGYVYFEEAPKTSSYAGASFTGKVWKSSLNIDPVELGDAGRYRCRVDFDISPTRNTRIKLKLVVRPTRPVIFSDDGKEVDDRTQPVPEGGDLKLYCRTSNGDPMPVVSWRKAGVPVNPDGLDTDAARGLVTSTLILRRLTRADQGSLVSCTAFNSDLIPALTTSVKIDILFPPVRASIVREWNFFTAGLAYNLSCQVLGSRPAPLTQVWLGSRPLPALHTKASIDGNVSTTTVELKPEKSDHGKFLSCQARNELIPNSGIEDQWRISVHYKPEVSLTRDDGEQVIREGEDLSLKCSVNASPQHHTIVWRKEGANVVDLEDKRLHILDDTLYISDISAEQEGFYTCEATNAAGTGSSNSVSVKVATSPSCKTNITEVVEVGLHEERRLVCDMKWVGPLDFRWVMVARELGQTVDFASSQFTQDGASSVLRFSARADADYGDLACLGVSRDGQSGQPCTFSIQPQGSPPALLSSCTTYNETYTSFTIDCSLRIEAAPLSHSLSYLFEVRDAHSQRSIRNVTTTEPKVALVDLPPSSDFVILVRSVSQSGFSQPVKLEGFTTRSGEKQLATKPELESRNPLKLIPILGALILISLVLVVITIGVVAVVRRRMVGGSTHTSPSSQLELLDNHKCGSELQDYSPDVIPKDTVGNTGPGYNAYGRSVEDLRYATIEAAKAVDTRQLAKENTFNTSFSSNADRQTPLQSPEVSYSELVFSSGGTSIGDPSTLARSQHPRGGGTEYALIMPQTSGTQHPSHQISKQATILPRPRRPEEVIKEVPGSCSSTRRLMAPGGSGAGGGDEMSGPCSSLSLDAVPTFEKDPTHFQAPQQTNSDKQNFDSNQFYTLPSSTRPPVVTCGMGSLKKVKFVDENVVNTDNFERHSLPRSRKEKLHLCPMHKHKLTGDKLDTVVEADSCRNPDDCHRRSNRLSTVAEAELSSTTDLAEPPPEWSEKVKVAGVEKVKVPPKSYKDVEFNL